MKKEIWQDKQKVLTQDLARAQSTSDGAILDRWTDQNDPGVVNDSQLVGEDFALQITPGDTSNVITINTGAGYSILGERIFVASPVVTYDPSKPSLTSDDGLGGFKPTPQSTGTKNIPLSPLNPNFTYYVWIGYLNTIDPAVFTIKKGSTEKLYVKGDDGYIAAVTTVNTNPDPTSYIFLGTATTNGASAITLPGISMANRQYFRAKPNRVGIEITADPTTGRPATYALGETKFLDQHVDAIGTGTVSPTNPHGLSATDLGISEISGIDHQSKFHSDGIFAPNQNTTTSALWMDVIVQTATNNDTCIIRAFTTSEAALVAGIEVSSSNIPSDITFTWLDGSLAPLPVGYYLFRLDSTTKTVERVGPYLSETDPLFLTALTATGKFPLWSILWDAVGAPGNYDPIIGTKKDWRVFGTTSAFNMQAQTVGALNMGASIGNRTSSFYNAKLVGSVASPSYNATGQTFIVTIDGGSPQTATFTGLNPLSAGNVANQINTQIAGIFAVPLPTGAIKILATDVLLVGNGTSNATLGFANLQTDSGDLKEVRIAGQFAGTVEMTYDGFGRMSVSDSRFGNKLLRQTINYLTASPTSPILTVVEEILNP